MFIASGISRQSWEVCAVSLKLDYGGLAILELQQRVIDLDLNGHYSSGQRLYLQPVSAEIQLQPLPAIADMHVQTLYFLGKHGVESQYVTPALQAGITSSQ